MNSYMQQLASDIGLSPGLCLDDVDELSLPVDATDVLLPVSCLMDDFPPSPGATSPSDCLLPADVMSDLSASPSMSLTSDMSLDTFHQLEATFELGDLNNNSGTDLTSDDTPHPARRTRGGEKYSLRPRSSSKRREEVMEVVRGRRRRTAASRGEDGVGGEKDSRPKPRPPPLSKYRRKTANARERDRMREINAAFELLRKAVPVAAAWAGAPCASPPGSPAATDSGGAGGGGEKLTKITTLRLAMRYIAALSQLLQSTAPPSSTQAGCQQAVGFQRHQNLGYGLTQP